MSQLLSIPSHIEGRQDKILIKKRFEYDTYRSADKESEMKYVGKTPGVQYYLFSWEFNNIHVMSWTVTVDTFMIMLKNSGIKNFKFND